MFNLPTAKRVRRADLYSPPSSSPEPSETDPELTALLQSRLENLYGPISTLEKRAAGSGSERRIAGGDGDGRGQGKNLITTKELGPKPELEEREEEEEEGEEQGFQFCLFATKPATDSRDNGVDGSGSAPVTRIILDDDNAKGDPSQQGGFIVPERDRGYYFTDVGENIRKEERKREFEAAAVSGGDVRRWAGVKYYGWEVRWRVRRLRVTGGGQLIFVGNEERKGETGGARPLVEGLGPKRGSGEGVGEVGTDGTDGRVSKACKPGKKRRIILRMRKRKVEEAAEQKRLEKARKMMGEREREAAEREKRTRRNREKKVKKKMREKEKKAQCQGQDAALQDAESDEDVEGE